MFSPKILTALPFLLFLLFGFSAKAITLGAGDENFVTTSDIVEEDDGIVSSLSGTSGVFNSITNNHIITTGDEGAKSSAYGVTLSGDYNEVINSVGSQINTTGSSGRAIDVDDNARIYNYGTINTLGRSGYGVYAGGDNNEVRNSGSIMTEDSSGHGIYFNGNDNDGENSGSISTKYGYGVYLNGNRNHFTNSASIETTDGSSAYGIYISAGSDLASSETEFTAVVNDGNINSSAHGIYNKDAYTHISNNGNIVSNALDSGEYGIANEGANAQIYNYGSITSSRYAFHNTNSGDSTDFYNYGDLNGDVRLGDSTLHLLGGGLSGSITGNDNQGRLVIGSDVDTHIVFNQADVYEELHSLLVTGQSQFNAYYDLEALSVEIGDGSSFSIQPGANVSADIYGYANEVGDLDIASDYATTNLIGQEGRSLGNINIAQGATLSYAGSIYANNVNVEGTFNMGSADMVMNGNLNSASGGKIKISDRSHIVTGDVDLKSGSIFEVSLSAGKTGSVNIVGDLHIEGDVGLNLDTSQNTTFIPGGSNFILLDVDGSKSDNVIFDENINVNNSGSNVSGILRYSTRYIENNLNLNISRVDANELSANKNVVNMYDYLNVSSEDSKGALLVFQTVLNSTQINEAESVLSEVMALSPKASLEAALKNINYLADISSQRLTEFDAKKDKKGSIWARPMGYSINQEMVGDDEAYGVNSIGFAIGVDKEFSEDFMAGVAINYVMSDIKTKDDLKKNLFSTVGFEYYSRSKFSHYFLDNFVGVAINTLSQSRAIKSVGLDATARYFGQSYLLKSKIGRAYKLSDSLNVIPSFALNYSLIKISGYEEDGAEELNLSVEGVSASYVKNEIGLEINTNIQLPNAFRESDFKFSDFLGFARISYGHFLKADKPEVTARFAGRRDEFSTKISNIDRSELGLTVGLKFFNEDDIEIGLEGSLVRRDSYVAHGFVVDFSRRF